MIASRVKAIVYRIVRRNKREFPRLLIIFKNITNSSHRMDQFGAKFFINFIPQITYASFDNIGLRVKVVIPDMFHDHGF
jgi:hypothetical protein